MTETASLVSLEPSLDLWATVAPWGLRKYLPESQQRPGHRYNVYPGAHICRKTPHGWEYVGRAYMTNPNIWEGETRTGPDQFEPMASTYHTLQSVARHMLKDSLNLSA